MSRQFELPWHRGMKTKESETQETPGMPAIPQDGVHTSNPPVVTPAIQGKGLPACISYGILIIVGCATAIPGAIKDLERWVQIGIYSNPPVFGGFTQAWGIALMVELLNVFLGNHPFYRLVLILASLHLYCNTHLIRGFYQKFYGDE